MLDTPGYYIGLWKNNDVWYYDVSVLVYSDLFAARLGMQELQISVWDCKRKECVYLPSLQDVHSNFKQAIRDGKQIVKIYGISVEIPTPQRTGTTYQKEAYITDSATKLTDNFYKVLRAVVSGDESAHLTMVSIYKIYSYA